MAHTDAELIGLIKCAGFGDGFGVEYCDIGRCARHEAAALSDAAFNYRVTFVDECGNEQAFCGTTDCP